MIWRRTHDAVTLQKKSSANPNGTGRAKRWGRTCDGRVGTGALFQLNSAGFLPFEVVPGSRKTGSKTGQGEGQFCDIRPKKDHGLKPL